MSDAVLVALLSAVFVLPLLIAGLNQLFDKEKKSAFWVKVTFPVLWFISIVIHYGLAYVGEQKFGEPAGGDMSAYWVFGAILNVVSALWLLAVVFEWED